MAAAAREASLATPDAAPLADVMQRWIDEDRKLTPLKALQGMIVTRSMSGVSDGGRRS